MCQPFYRGFRSFVQEANKIIDYLLIFFDGSGAHRDLHSFPTRRSSDLPGLGPRVVERASLACPEAKGQGNWAGAVEGLRALLAQAPLGKGEATLIVSSHFVRYVVLPWSEELISEAEELEFARTRFLQVFG